MKQEAQEKLYSALLAFSPFSAFTSEQRKEIGREQHWTCQRCGKQFKDGWMMEINHETPLFEGGTDTLDNGEVLCLSCHYLFHEERGDKGAARLIHQRLEQTGGRTRSWLKEHS